MEKSREEFFCYSVCWARGNSCWECLCAQLELPLCSVWLQGICGCWDLWAPRARLFGSSPLVANMKVGVRGMWISFFHGEAGELVFYFWGEPWGGSRGHAYLGSWKDPSQPPHAGWLEARISGSIWWTMQSKSFQGKLRDGHFCFFPLCWAWDWGKSTCALIWKLFLCNTVLVQTTKSH